MTKYEIDKALRDLELLNMLERHRVQDISSLAGIVCACLKGE